VDNTGMRKEEELFEVEWAGGKQFLFVSFNTHQKRKMGE